MNDSDPTSELPAAQPLSRAANDVGRGSSNDVGRRQFVVSTLATAAATALGGTVGAASTLKAQTTSGASSTAGASAVAQQQAPPLALGNAEPPALQFQPYVGGVGALTAKLARERGWSAFERAEFVASDWSGPLPTSDEDIAFLPASKLSALIRDRKLTASKLTDIYLQRISKYNPTLNFAVTVMESQAREQARRADEEIRNGRYRGALHGLPYGLKDLFSTRGVRTTWGAKDFENRIIDEDSEIVVRLREAGAILLVKLSTGLFAQNDWWFGGRTNNPWNPDIGSSGSSAGPAAATAAGCVAFAIGTETQGSIVSPAIRTGITALRPTFGRVSRHGGMVLAWSQDRVGPMARSAEDCAMVFNVLHGVDEKDPSTVTTPFQFNRNVSLSSFRIGVDPNAPAEFVAKLRELGVNPISVGARPTVAGMAGGGLNVEYAAAFEDYVERKAKETGIDLNAAAASVSGRAGGAGSGGAASANSAMPRSASCMAPADWNPRFVRGRSVSAYQFLQNQRRRFALMTAWEAYMKELDMFIAAPTADIGATAQTGHPCVVLPYKMGKLVSAAGSCPPPATGWENKVQPVAAVIIGNLYEDDKILAVAHQFQSATDFHLQRPELS